MFRTRLSISTADLAEAVRLLAPKDAESVALLAGVLGLSSGQSPAAVTDAPLNLKAKVPDAPVPKQRERSASTLTPTTHTTADATIVEQSIQVRVLHEASRSYVRPAYMPPDAAPLPAEDASLPPAGKLKPLVPATQSRSFLWKAAAQDLPGDELDVDSLINDLAAGVMPRFKTILAKSVRNGVQLLIDDSPSMVHFREDAREFLRHAQAIIGPALLETHYFQGTPGRREQPEGGTGGNAFCVRRPGITVIIVSSFGASRSRAHPRVSRAEWTRYLLELIHSGARVTCLCPFSPDKWPKIRHNRCRFVYWGNQQRFDPTIQARDLARLLSVAAILDRSVIRATRRALLPGAAAGLEDDLLSGPWVAAANVRVVALDIGALRDLRAELAKREAERERALAVLRTYREEAGASPPSLRLEESIIASTLRAEEDALKKALSQLILSVAQGPSGATMARRAWTLVQSLPLPVDDGNKRAHRDLKIAAALKLGLVLEQASTADPSSAWLLPDDDSKVGVQWLAGHLVFSVPPVSGSAVIRVPATEPCHLRIVWPDGTRQPHDAQVWQGHDATVPHVNLPVVISTLSGSRFELSSKSRAEDSQIEARRRIAHCRSKEADTLDLGGLGLNVTPDEISELQWLRKLRLNDNHLTSIIPEIGHLMKLTQLDVSNNKLASLPPEIGMLLGLKDLNFRGNLLVALPPELFQIEELSRLNLSVNNLSLLPPEIDRLRALEELALTDNQLSSLPNGLQRLTKLQLLYLHGNERLNLPPEILGGRPNTSIPPTSAKRILDFYFGQRRSDASSSLDEVKLILIGRGGAGKTSLVRALQKGRFLDHEGATADITQSTWTMPCERGPVTAHIWDFAGQVITHAVHQFFFSPRSVYLLVLTGREDSERDDAEYWLRLVKAFGTDDKGNGPPVIVVLNKLRVAPARLDRHALQSRYPFIEGFVETDCKTSEGIDKLRSLLCRVVDPLEWVRARLPKSWIDLRSALIATNKPYITREEYQSLCAAHGIAELNNQETVAQIFHDLGIALNFHNDPRLRDVTVLQPQWLTQNIYMLIRHAEEQEGVLKRADMDKVLGRKRDPVMRSYLVGIMERFDLAIASSVSSDAWLVPQALPDTQPHGVESFRDASDATRLRYTYQYLPEGLVARVIVRLIDFIEEVEGKKQQWASGAVFARAGARALIRTEPPDRQIAITATGPKDARRQLAGLCQAEMRNIHAAIRGLDPLEETQVEGALVSVLVLETDEKKGSSSGIATDRGTITVDPAAVLNAFSDQSARVLGAWKPTVFITYSSTDAVRRRRLESELIILKNEGLLASVWHDLMITPGDSMDDLLQRELARADLVIFLVSPASLSSSYITSHEIPRALEQQRADKTIVVPIILEACRWERTALRVFSALPEKAKPLAQWSLQADGWNSIANGLARVLKTLLAKRSGA